MGKEYITKRKVKEVFKKKLWEKLNEENPSLKVLELSAQIFGLTPNRREKKERVSNGGGYDEEILKRHNKGGYGRQATTNGEGEESISGDKEAI